MVICLWEWALFPPAEGRLYTIILVSHSHFWSRGLMQGVFIYQQGWMLRHRALTEWFTAHVSGVFSNVSISMSIIIGLWYLYRLYSNEKYLIGDEFLCFKQNTWFFIITDQNQPLECLIFFYLLFYFILSFNIYYFSNYTMFRDIIKNTVALKMIISFH